MSDNENIKPSGPDAASKPSDKTGKIEDGELEKVTGGINPQPLPPHAPPER